ncbi:MAG: type II toxin-antitoxin system death-on-curing family toxin [bacterium]|nr:type II toxin-antitoxin system death-on-curing family toxin [bacterium]MBU1917748.1 type II toxin-antitoxin system death-on-curing family toxin [bacterium]
MTLYPTLEEALELYQTIIDEFGGAHGVRDMGLLESALYRPQTGYYDDLFSMAAALMESLLLNHPFVDGNKRMAFYLTDTFLRMNGYKIKVLPKNGLKFIENIISDNEKRLNRITKWLQKQSIATRRVTN